MAIRTPNLGGTVWNEGFPLLADDLNDTNDEIKRIVDNGN